MRTIIRYILQGSIIRSILILLDPFSEAEVICDKSDNQWMMEVGFKHQLVWLQSLQPSEEEAKHLLVVRGTSLVYVGRSLQTTSPSPQHRSTHTVPTGTACYWDKDCIQKGYHQNVGEKNIFWRRLVQHKSQGESLPYFKVLEELGRMKNPAR